MRKKYLQSVVKDGSVYKISQSSLKLQTLFHQFSDCILILPFPTIEAFTFSKIFRLKRIS